MQFPLSPIFNVTLRAAASWVFFRVAGSTRVNPDMGASEARKNVGFSDLGRRSPNARKAVRNYPVQQTFILDSSSVADVR